MASASLNLATYNGGAHGNGTVFRLNVPCASLSIALSGGQILLSWPSWASDLRLEMVSDLTMGNWATVTNSPVVIAQQNQVVLAPMLGGRTFFRLSQ